MCTHIKSHIFDSSYYSNIKILFWLMSPSSRMWTIFHWPCHQVIWLAYFFVSWVKLLMEVVYKNRYTERLTFLLEIWLEIDTDSFLLAFWLVYLIIIKILTVFTELLPCAVHYVKCFRYIILFCPHHNPLKQTLLFVFSR